jgi:hypothetical protein
MKRYFFVFFLSALLTSTAFSQKTVYNLQNQKGWQGFALMPSKYLICSSCSGTGTKINWDRKPGISSPSLSGKATEHHIGGSTSFADVLWNNHIIGDFSSQGIHDYSHTLVPRLHNFVYDVHFYVKNLPVSQALEFDINQFTGGKSFIWGHECRLSGGHEWDTWNNVKKHWVPTGVPCYPKNNAWNHLVIKAQRTSGGKLLFKSITLNGKTAILNIVRSPNTTSWHGVTINYQQDLNRYATDYSIWLDKLNFTYW